MAVATARCPGSSLTAHPAWRRDGNRLVVVDERGSRAVRGLATPAKAPDGVAGGPTP